MKFSIIIPVYNVEEYVGACIGSILQQTHQEVEIILIDDGSTDDSGKICDRYVLEYPDTIKVFHHQNQGPLRARCDGISHAAGDVCVFVDSDDCLRKDALEKMNTKFTETGCDLLLFNASTTDDFSTPFRTFTYHDGQCFSGEEKAAVYEVMITTSKLNAVCLKAVKRKIAAECAGEELQFSGRNGEDLLQSLPMVTRAEKICYLNQNLYYYRPRPGSAVHTFNPERHKSIRYVHQKMEKYIDVWGMQHLHPRHYAREVRGWVDCLKQLLVHPGNRKQNGAADLMRELAEDAYFRNAYDRMAPDVLSASEKRLARWLYEKSWLRLKLAGAAARGVKKIQRLLKKAA